MPEASKNQFADLVIVTVADYFLVNPKAIRGKTRTKNLAQARQMVFYLMRLLARMSFPEIGEAVGKKDHTTVMAGVRRITEKRKEDKRVDQAATDLELKLKSLLDGSSLGYEKGMWVMFTQPVVDRLAVLVESGCFGDSVPQAVERIVSREVYELTGEVNIEVQEEPTDDTP